MRTLLILTHSRPFAGAVQAAVDAGKYQLIVKEDVRAAEPLLDRNAVDCVILDADAADGNAIQLIEAIRSAAPAAAVIVAAQGARLDWEEDAYLQGAAHVFRKPLRGRLLNHLLERILEPPADHLRASAAEPAGERDEAGASARPAPAEPGSVGALEGLRKFSAVLTRALEPEVLLREFLLMLRQVIGVNRAAVFLRSPSGILGTQAPEQEDRWLRSACAIGLEQSFLEHFALNLKRGIGASLRRHGRILRSTGSEARENREVAREFQLLGATVAIPILDRETLLGVAMLDERLTGDRFENEELTLLFQTLEEVGVAIRHSWQHDQLETRHAMLADVLANLGAGCAVIGSSLEVLHCNAAARDVLLAGKPGKSRLEFGDLPQELGSKVFTVLKTNVAAPSFRFDFPGKPDHSYQVAISPYQVRKAAGADAALLIIEDITEADRARKLEVEAASLRMVTTMAEHLAHEIGNSVVPLSTYQQLLDSGQDDEEFRASLSEVLGAGVKRITRLANQMMFLARGKTDFGDQIRVRDLLDEAFREACVYHSGHPPDTGIATGAERLTIMGDHKALRHAFSEVLLNALQATRGEPKKIAVTVRRTGGNGHAGVNVEIKDAGGGFTPEAAERGPEPFFSTRNVGLGLGLTVTRKIIEDHQGKVEIGGPGAGSGTGLVRITLPLSDQN